MAREEQDIVREIRDSFWAEYLGQTYKTLPGVEKVFARISAFATSPLGPPVFITTMMVGLLVAVFCAPIVVVAVAAANFTLLGGSLYSNISAANRTEKAIARDIANGTLVDRYARAMPAEHAAILDDMRQKTQLVEGLQKQFSGAASAEPVAATGPQNPTSLPRRPIGI